MRKLKVWIYIFLIIGLGLLFFKKNSKNSDNYYLDASISTQTYCYYDFMGEQIWGIVSPAGARIMVTLDEYYKYIPTSEDREDEELWWSVRNFSNATLSREETKTFSLSGKIGSNIKSSIDIITMEINAEISSSYSQTIKVKIDVKEYSSVDVYSYKPLKKVSYMKETAQLQIRTWFFYINIGEPHTTYDTVRSYKGASHYLKEYKLK